MKENPNNLLVNGVAFRAERLKVLSETNFHPESISIFDVTTSNLDLDFTIGKNYLCIMGVTFSPNSNYIAAIEESANIFIFDNTGASPILVNTLNTITSYTFSTTISPSNDKVALGCSNEKLKIYNLTDRTLASDINAQPNWVTTVAFSFDRTCKISNFSNDNFLTTFGIVDSCAVNTVTWSLVGNKIVTDNSKSGAVLWKIPTNHGISYFFNENYFKITLLPNPASEQISININKNLNVQKVEIIDVNGKVVYSFNQLENTIPINNLRAGIYYLSIQTSYNNKTINYSLKIKCHEKN